MIYELIIGNDFNKVIALIVILLMIAFNKKGERRGNLRKLINN